MSQFLYTVCQRGAEPALKAELAKHWPDFRFAYSRPGFVTFKLPDGADLPEDFDLQSVFARTYGFSLGKVTGTDAQAMAREAWRLATESEFAPQRSSAALLFSPSTGEGGKPAPGGPAPEGWLAAQSSTPQPVDHAADPSHTPPPPASHPAPAAEHPADDDSDIEQQLAAEEPAESEDAEEDVSGALHGGKPWVVHYHRIHAWERDIDEPGHHGFEPGVTPLAEEVGQLIRAEMGEQAPPVNRLAKPGQRVLDVVLVEPNEWWIGYHRAAAAPSRWPGGVYPVDLPEEVVSRAYLKMAEALAWSRLPIEREDCCVELGSSPGGSCQALLDRGCEVVGVDPAEMAPELLEHENFIHVRARSQDIKRREFAGIQWLMADLNVAPNYTLDTVESIVTHHATNFRGLILTLKLSEWELAAHIPEYLERVRGWGFEYVRARQLSYNRQEICVAAMRRRQMRRKPFWRTGGKRRR